MKYLCSSCVEYVTYMNHIYEWNILGYGIYEGCFDTNIHLLLLLVIHTNHIYECMNADHILCCSVLQCVAVCCNQRAAPLLLLVIHTNHIWGGYDMGWLRLVGSLKL